jgi:hypothetical protein
MAPFLYSTYREQNRTPRDIGVWNIKPSSVTGLAEPEQINVLLVTGAILPLLGISPALGRWFSARDDSPGTRETAVLMYGYWQSRFGGDRSVIGRGLYRRQPVAGDGNHRNGAADRLRQRGQPAAGASRCPPAGTGHPQRSGRRLADECLQT